MSLRKPTHDTLGAMDPICYISLGTVSRFSGNQVAKIESLTTSVIISLKREIHEENLIIHEHTRWYFKKHVSPAVSISSMLLW